MYSYLTIIAKLNNDYLDGPDPLNTPKSYQRDFLAGIFTIFSLHFLHVSEARFVLQNRLPNF
jgi:hypothetical protein